MIKSFYHNLQKLLNQKNESQTCKKFSFFKSHAQYQEMIIQHLKKWEKRKSRRLDPELRLAILILIRINLDPARPILKDLYSPRNRRKPYDPVCMLRAFLLMIILQYEGITQFARDLRRIPRLAIIAGFEPYKTPGVGTFYLFIDRIFDGPFKPKCDHFVKPSSIFKGKYRRNLKKEREEREERRKQILKECDSITEDLAKSLLESSHQPRPQDYLKLLEDLLTQIALIPSAKRGLLGNLNAMVVSGDGSALVSGANSSGKPTCSCRKKGIYNCDHDRLYSDPTADWGYDPYREIYYFGHTYYQHCASFENSPLPLHILIGKASETDFTLSLKSADRMLKTLSKKWTQY